MKNQLPLLVLMLWCLGCHLGSEQTQTQRKELPNIVLIIGDDHGYPYFGFMGADYVKTPHMDELAASGTTFTHGFVPDNHCRPSLATLVTSLLPIDYRNKVGQLIKEKNITDESRRDFEHHAMKHFETLPKLLKRKGYNSFQSGKWWEFNYQNGGFTHGMTTGWTEEDRQAGGEWFKKFMGGEGLQLTRVTHQPVFDFIDAHKEQAFFLWFAPELPHYPFDAPDEYYQLYQDQNMSESAKRYYANCSWFDDGVGELIAYLKNNNEFENTLFIYVNDNGWEQAPDQEFWEDPMRSHNGGDKGKSSIYDQSFRTPIIFAWEGHIEKGKRLEQLIHSADIPATILDYLEMDVPDYFFGQSYLAALKGKDFSGRSEIIGNVTSTRSEESVMGQPTEGYWLRNKEWFFSWNVTKGEKALYDMQRDPYSNHNLARTKAELVDKFTEKIELWRQSKIN